MKRLGEMKSTPALQMADVVAWGRNRLAAGSHWETDLHYTTAVRACGSLQGIHRPIEAACLAGFHYREEGYAAIDRQKARQSLDIANPAEEFKKFDRLMREMMRVSRKQPQPRLVMEKEFKQKRR